MRWGEAKTHLRTLLAEDRLPDDEPIVLKFPRKEARKRIRNTEKKSRVIFVTTPENYQAFHAARAHVIEATGNPTIADKLISEVIYAMPAETWRKFMEAGDSEA
jgi:hypothetical protein